MHLVAFMLYAAGVVVCQNELQCLRKRCVLYIKYMYSEVWIIRHGWSTDIVSDYDICRSKQTGQCRNFSDMDSVNYKR